MTAEGQDIPTLAQPAVTRPTLLTYQKYVLDFPVLSPIAISALEGQFYSSILILSLTNTEIGCVGLVQAPIIYF